MAKPIRIVIDPNVRVRGNKTYAGFEDIQARGGLTVTRPEQADAPVAAGDHVLALEAEDNIVTDAVVVEMDYEKQFVYLAVNWGNWRDDDPRQTPDISFASIPSAPSNTGEKER